MTITIRPATPNDLDAMLAMGEKFFAYAKFSKFVDFNAGIARGALAALLDTGFVCVAEIDGVIAGGLAGLLAPVWFNPWAVAATEVAWWVAEEHRKGLAGIRLLREFEQWATDNGASMIVMSDLVIDGDTPAGRLFEKLGYEVVERSHVRKAD